MRKLRIAAVQAYLRPDCQDPIEYTTNHIVPLLQSCKEMDLIVLPELCPIGYSEHTFHSYLDDISLHRRIDDIMSEVARNNSTYISYGRIDSCPCLILPEDSKEEQQLKRRRRIQQVVVNDTGEIIASYDKILLCDYGDCAETRFFAAGQGTLCSFLCRDVRVGILICADMRDPTLARNLVAIHDVDVIVQPAAFGRDLSFRTWKSFRETRAVENSVYWVGVNYAGTSFGNSSFNPPWIDEDNEPQVLGMKESILLGEVDTSILQFVRTRFPYYDRLKKEQNSLNECSARENINQVV
jgi:predicted amidohydrolase